MSGTSALKKGTPQRPSRTATPDRIMFQPGRICGFIGDSWWAGTGALPGKRAVDIIPRLVGYAYISKSFLDKGIGGQSTAGMLARFNADIINGGARLAVGISGSNDANAGVTVSTYANGVTRMAQAAQAAGIPFFWCTAQPRTAAAFGTTAEANAYREKIAGYNAWLRLAGPGLGINVIDVWSTVADPATGDLLPAYDNGDGIHPNQAGHYAIARTVADALKEHMRAQPGLVTSIQRGNYVTNPLMAGTGTIATGWSEASGGTGTAPTYSIEDDTTGLLEAGRWQVMDFNATAGGTRRLSTNVGTAWALGDRLMVCANLAIEDIAGFTTASLAGTTADCTLHLVNGTTGVQVGSAITALVGTDPGPIAAAITLPSSGLTSLVLWLSCTLPSGARARFKLGAVGVYNLTQLGLDGLVTV